MSRRARAFEAVFEIYKKEGRELRVRELREKYPAEAAELRRAYNGQLNKAIKKLRKVYLKRWNEITGVIVHPEPIVKIEEPKVEAKVEEPKVEEPEDLTPLDRLKKAIDS
jgi:hypothetical protein